MKDIIKVSISGIAFILDDDAFHVLESYLSKLEAGYKNNPDSKEIIADIEARMAEIILAKQDADTMVKLELVEKIVEQLGIPEELQAAAEQGAADIAGDPDMSMKMFPRRLYRNPEGAKLGGVCSGLGTFLDVDAVWIRLGFFLPLILLILTSTIDIDFIHEFLGTAFGAMFLSYIILWFAIPIAKTPRQRLEMRGQKITASAIHNSMRDNASKMPGDTKCGQRSASIIAELAYVLGRILLFGVKVLALLIGLVLAIGAIALMVAFCTFMFGNSEGSICGFVSQIQINGMSNSLYLALLSLVALAPIIVITYLLLRLVFNLPANRTILSIILFLWLALTVYVGYVTVNNFDNIRKCSSIVSVRGVCDFGDDDYVDEELYDTTTVVTEGIIEGDSTRVDSVVVKVSSSRVPSDKRVLPNTRN